MCGKGSATTTQQQAQTGLQSATQTPNPIASAAYQQLLGQVGQVGQTPYTPFGGQLVAPVNEQQQLGIGNINANAGYAQPFINTAAGYAALGAAPITGSQISNYLNPYTQDVVNATQAAFANQNAQQQQQVRGNAAAQGALGGDREAVAQGELARQQALAENPQIAGLYSQGFNTALSAAQAQQQQYANAGYQFGNLGISGQNAALQGANAQIGAGTLEQQTAQAQNNAAYQQYLAAQGYPYQQLSWASGLTTGLGGALGGTTAGQNFGTTYGTTTAPPPNPISQYAGLGLTGAALFANRGGRIPHRAEGGGGIGIPFNGTPYSGGASFIPSAQINPVNPFPQLGNIAPSSLPALKDQQQPDPMKMVTDASKMAKAIRGISNKTNDYMVTNPDSTYNTTGDAAPIDATGDLGGFYAQGGTVEPGGIFLRGYDEGGDVPIDETIAPGPAIVNPSGISVRGGEAAPVGLASNPLAATRGSFIDETNNPAVRNRLMRLAEAEVGSQGPAAAHAFLESVFNRAAARGQTLTQAMNDRDYYPRVSIVGKTPSDPGLYTNALDNVLSGSNVSRYATGNASGRVGFAGGPQTYNPGTGERFGIEGPDQQPMRALALAQSEGDTDTSGLPPEITQGRSAGIGNQALGYAPEARGEELNARLSPQTRPAPSGGGFGGLFGNPLGLSSDARQGLLAAGLGMLSSRSPFLGTAIGEGGLAGLKTYTQLQEQHTTERQRQETIQQAADRLSQQAEQHRQDLAQKTKAQTETTGLQRAKIEQENWKAGTDAMGHPFMVNTKSGEVRGVGVPGATIPITTSPTPARSSQTAAPPGTQSTPAVSTPPPAETGVPSSPVQAANSPSSGVRVASIAPINIPEGMTVGGAKPDAVTVPPPLPPKKYNEEALQGLTPDEQTWVKALAKYEMLPSQIPVRAPQQRIILTARAKQYDDTYDAAMSANVQRAKYEWQSGKHGDLVRNFSTAIAHIDLLNGLIKNLDNKGSTTWNKLVNAYKAEFNSPAPTNYDAASRIVAQEIVKATVGGQNALGDRDEIAENFNRNRGPDQQRGVIDVYRGLMAGQLHNLEGQYVRSTHQDDFKKLLSPEAQEAFYGRGFQTQGASDIPADKRQQALDWIRDNPKDPNVPAIKRSLGIQ